MHAQSVWCVNSKLVYIELSQTQNMHSW